MDKLQEQLDFRAADDDDAVENPVTYYRRMKTIHNSAEIKFIVQRN